MSFFIFFFPQRWLKINDRGEEECGRPGEIQSAAEIFIVLQPKWEKEEQDKNQTWI